MAGEKLLFDVGVGKKAEAVAVQLGFDVKSVRSIDARLPDSAILKLALAEGRMLVTMDKDFGELVYRESEQSVGVLLLRMEDADGEAKARTLRSILLNHAEQLVGHFSVYQNGVLRIR